MYVNSEVEEVIDLIGMAKRIEKAARYRGMSTTELAQVAGVSDQSIQGFFNMGTGTRKATCLYNERVQLDKLRRLAKTLGVSTSWLITGSGKERWIRELHEDEQKQEESEANNGV